MRGNRGFQKKPYPRRGDIAEAILAVLALNPFIHPDDLIEEVRKELEKRKFYVGLVSAKRVWNEYVNLVKKRRIYDVLNVVDTGRLE